MVKLNAAQGQLLEFAKRKALVGREFLALRVTLGTADEMKRFLVAFLEIFRS